jgi:zona occludens toxin (predicted ATPase)
MRPSGKGGFSAGGRISSRKLVVLLAIFAICVSVATRTFHGIYLDQPSVQADPSHALRQHLAADAFVLTNPVLNLGAMLLPVAAPHAPPVEAQVRTFDLTESLYNRPPPSISLP